MSVINVPQDNFQMILVLLKYIASKNNLNVENNTYSITGTNLKDYLLKYVVSSIELKNTLITHFYEIISSIDKAILMFDKESDKILITKNQICSVLKPLVTKAAHPFDNYQLNQFFSFFDCESTTTDFFIDLMSPK